MRLTKICTYSGTIHLKSGLHIDSGDMEMHIGGTDRVVIKHPHTLEPYIPGSSLKGKTRSLLELETQLILATRLGLLPQDTSRQMLQQTSEVGRLIHGLSNALSNKLAGH